MTDETVFSRTWIRRSLRALVFFYFFYFESVAASPLQGAPGRARRRIVFLPAPRRAFCGARAQRRRRRRGVRARGAEAEGVQRAARLSNAEGDPAAVEKPAPTISFFADSSVATTAPNAEAASAPCEAEGLLRSAPARGTSGRGGGVSSAFWVTVPREERSARLALCDAQALPCRAAG